VSATVPASATDAISYDDLYARWERSNWRATEIDFSQDVVDWNEKMTPEQRRSALWLYTLFFHGEDSVADNLSPYIDAAPLEEQKYFLTTQQVDEARHAVLFHRFMREVVGVGDASIASTLRATDPEITWGHRKVFGRLDQMADELRADRSNPQLARAVTLYHIVVEASMAQPGQHMIERYLEELDLLPGFREGMRNVALDEQRHIGFGVKLLADLYREDPERIGDAIVGALREVLPWTAAVAKPPGWDETYMTAFGFTYDDLGEEGARSLEQKLRSVGLPIDSYPGFPMDMTLPPRERARRGRVMLAGNFIGPDRPVARDEETLRVVFDAIAQSANSRAVPDGMTVQWDFTDAEPWHVVVANGSSSAQRGPAAGADVTLRMSLEDFGDVIAERADPRRLLLKRRVRVRGNPRMLLKLPAVFGG
jgi:ribonucleotide reductase beta subunit family protein with ferritin-like domain/putative sterol carrier protein